MELREILKKYPDGERALSRLAIGRGGPRDLGNIRDSLQALVSLKSFLLTKSNDLPASLMHTLDQIDNHHDLLDRLQMALMDELPFLARDGRIIRPGHAPHLDHIRNLRDESQRIIKALQEKYRASTGVGSLKVKHNNVIGYHVEVPPAHASKMVEPFIHRQTLGNSVRFTTTELIELEEELVQSEEKTLAIETEIYHGLINDALAHSAKIIQSIDALAMIDCFAGLAETAARDNYTRPEIIQHSKRLEINAGRHPVVEAFIEKGVDFIPNDCHMNDDENLWLISGPNMSGKSTFLRQNAIIVISGPNG